MRITSMAIAAALTFTGAPADGKDFTTCMSERGFTATVTDGRIVLGDGVNPFSKEYRAALKECESLLPDDSPLPVEPKLPDLAGLPELAGLPKLDFCG